MSWGEKGCTGKCVQRGSKINVLGGYGAEVKDHVLGEKGLYREVCPEGVQNKCPGGVRCRGFMSWGYTLILVISRGVQLYYGIAH